MKRGYAIRNNKNNRIYLDKTVVYILIMLVALVLGIWFVLSPTVDRNRMLDHKDDLIVSIEQGDGIIILSDTFVAEDVDFYGVESGPAQGFDAPVIDSEEGTIDSSSLSSAEITSPEDTVIAGIGILTIDRINARLPVTQGASTAQLKVAVGHVSETPEIGAVGNAVIAGHRSYTFGRFFNRLDELVLGDIIQYQSIEGSVLLFEVIEILEVLPGDPVVFWPSSSVSGSNNSNNVLSDNERLLTLLTCTPIITASHRLIVRARLINFLEGLH